MVIDKSLFEINIVKEFLDDYLIKYIEKILLDKGNLLDYVKVIIKDVFNDGVNYIYVVGVDILIYNIINYLNDIGRNDVMFFCCNNFKMCCGEGICGVCIVRFVGYKVR